MASRRPPTHPGTRRRPRTTHVPLDLRGVCPHVSKQAIVPAYQARRGRRGQLAGRPRPRPQHHPAGHRRDARLQPPRAADPALRSPSACVGCMACVSACPDTRDPGARSCPSPSWTPAIERVRRRPARSASAARDDLRAALRRARRSTRTCPRGRASSRRRSASSSTRSTARAAASASRSARRSATTP